MTDVREVVAQRLWDSGIANGDFIAGQLLTALKSANIELTPGWCDDMSKAPRNEEVLIYFDFEGLSYIETGEHVSKNMWSVGENCHGCWVTPTHWMPLPAPPENRTNTVIAKDGAKDD